MMGTWGQLADRVLQPRPDPDAEFTAEIRAALAQHSFPEAAGRLADWASEGIGLPAPLAGDAAIRWGLSALDELLPGNWPDDPGDPIARVEVVAAWRAEAAGRTGGLEHSQDGSRARPGGHPAA